MTSTSGPVIGVLLGYLLLMWTNPVRASLKDGLRVVRRYPRLAVTLGVFGFGYAVFQLALRWWLARQGGETESPAFRWMGEMAWRLPASAWTAALRGAAAPALDSTAGLFNNLVSTFPLAALAALLLVVNWGGYQGVLWQALRRRCGRWAVAVHAGILLCALAALAKPALYGLPGHVDGQLWLRWSPVVAWLAFLFEYLFGVGVQLYLLLLAYCWVRGLTFHHGRLLAFAIRRFSFVLRWAAVVMALSTLCLDLPLMLPTVPTWASWFPAQPAEVDRWAARARLLLAAVFLAASTVQITLTLHNESLRRSLRDHARFVRRHAWPLGWFILLAGLHFYLLHLVDGLCRLGLGEGTALWVGWSLLQPWLAGALGAWLLASWVSMFKRTDVGRLEDQEWVKF